VGEWTCHVPVHAGLTQTSLDAAETGEPQKARKQEMLYQHYPCCASPGSHVSMGVAVACDNASGGLDDMLPVQQVAKRERIVAGDGVTEARK
jgi:hypothetical protein